MIKNIVFDMGNVLLKFAPQDFIKTIIDDDNIAAEVLNELFYSKEWQALDEGAITEERAVEQVSLRIPQHLDYVRKAMEGWHSDLTPIPGMLEIVKELKARNYRIYLLSNASLRFHKYRDEIEVFKYFDGLMVSAEEKLVKPNRAIFDCICDKFSLNHQECLFIDDLQHNIDGAINAGLQGHLFLGAQELTEYLKRENILTVDEKE